MNNPDFATIVATNWSNTCDYFNALEHFTAHAQYWNKHIFGNIFYRKKSNTGSTSWATKHGSYSQK